MDYMFTISAVAFNLLIAGIFLSQRHGKIRLIRTFGSIVIGLALPFAVVLISYFQSNKGWRVYVGVGFALFYILVEFLLDYVFKVDFRSKWITHIPYILLEYAAFFGLISAAFAVSQTSGWIVSVTFWIAMACLVYLYSGAWKKK
ncbi:MAG TPA: hypothetical protein VMW28_07285 [Pelolinea sp.]|nr:hypothetical protein [Pelolinea sp.]